MSEKNLWGSIPKIDVKPPVVILREQAAMLGQMTDNVLEGRVRQVMAAPGQDLSYILDIIAPALDRYYYSVLQVDHKVAPFYPLQVTLQISDKTFVGRDEAEFVDILSRFLSSEQVQQVIASLLVQSTALEQAA